MAEDGFVAGWPARHVSIGSGCVDGAVLLDQRPRGRRNVGLPHQTFADEESRHAKARQPGQASSGGITVSQAQQIEQQLSQAASLASAGGAKNDEAALVLYNDVLSTDPSNPAGLAGAGWLMWNLGTSSHVAAYTEDGRSEVTRAVRVSPTYYQGHLYLGLILANEDHNNAAAAVQFDNHDNHSGATVQFDNNNYDDQPSSAIGLVRPSLSRCATGVGVECRPIVFQSHTPPRRDLQ